MVGRFQTPIRDTQYSGGSFVVPRPACAEGWEWSTGAAGTTRFVIVLRLGLIYYYAAYHQQARRTSGTGNAFASFLLGEVNSANVNVSDRSRLARAYWAGMYRTTGA